MQQLKVMLAIMIACAFGVIASSANAATVIGSNVNCRLKATASSKLVTRLRSGETVPVLTRKSSWSYVDPAEAAACWVASRYLSDGGESISDSASVYRSDAYASARRKSARSSAYRSRTRSASASSRRRSSRRSSSRGMSVWGASSSCPCSGGNICVGPRGGRYCITSGGNKRYGV